MSVRITFQTWFTGVRPWLCVCGLNFWYNNVNGLAGYNPLSFIYTIYIKLKSARLDICLTTADSPVMIACLSSHHGTGFRPRYIPNNPRKATVEKHLSAHCHTQTHLNVHKPCISIYTRVAFSATKLNDEDQGSQPSSTNDMFTTMKDSQ